MERDRRSQSGFTLVELLVVILLIAVLAALLLPVISRAKNRAKETICLNNLRQIGVGLRLYENDNSGRFPIHIGKKGALSTPPASRKDNRSDWRFFDMAIGGGEPAPTTPPQLPRAAERPLFNYIKNFETFHCPFDAGWDFRPDPEYVTPSAYAAHGCSYLYNAHRSSRNQPLGLEGLSGKPESWVPDPSIFILMYEPPAYVETSTSGGFGFVVFWHRARKAGTMRVEDYNLSRREKRISPILFVDGHAAILNFKEPLNINTTEWMWWKPEH